MTVLPINPGPFALSGLSSDDTDLVNGLVNRLAYFESSNAIKLAYYEGDQRVQQLGISIPASLSNIEVVVGWAGTTVDVIEERLDWYGWRTDAAEDFGLGAVYAQNRLALDSARAHLDALIYGTSFAVVGSGDADEPSPLITVHSPRRMTGLWNARKRRLDAALSVDVENGETVGATLYKPDETITLERANRNGSWIVVDRDLHRIGRPLVVQIENRPRNDVCGRSEISKAVRSLTDQAVRTMLGMEIHREFYVAPQRYILGATAEDFTAADGSVRTGWEMIMGRMLALDRDEDGNLPEIGQFSAASPAPYLDQVKGLAQLLAAEAAIPPSYLGFQTDNPASADAIQRSEARLVKRAERRQLGFGHSWMEVGRLALLVRDGRVPDGFDAAVSPKWRDASTPTRSAAADEAVKLSAGDDPIIPRDSSVLYDRIGLDPDEQRQLAADKRRSGGSAALTAITSAVANDPAALRGDASGV